MPVYSMTGYASVQSHGPSPSENPTAPDGQRIGLEIRAVNSRFLDLSFRISDELRQAEPALRELLTGSLKRGKIELRAFTLSQGSTVVAEPSPGLLQRLNHAQDSIRAWLPTARELAVADVLRLASLDAGQSGKDTDLTAPTVALAQQAVLQLLASREREGRRLAAALLERVGQLAALAADATPLVPQLMAQQRQKFLDRWAEALGATDGALPPQAAQDRALTEATAFAIRIDVAEELTRLSVHLQELSRLLAPTPAAADKKSKASSPEIGKRLDFVIQELHREANTLGAKSSTLEMTRISVDMKVLIEQMREQVQNIE